MDIGKLITSPQERDAIHVAIAPMKAAYYIRPGDFIRITSNGAVSCNPDESIGIADPFLPQSNITLIDEGADFWCFLLPNTVTGMRHHWQHPAFSDDIENNNKKDKSESELWLIEFSKKWNMDFDDLINGAVNGDYVVAIGQDLHSADELDPGDEELFWYHLSKYTGKTFSKDHRDGMGWSCSC